MIMYEYGEWTNGVGILYTRASLSKKVNETQELNFTTIAKYIRQNSIEIDYRKIFFVDSQYYVPVSIKKSDAKIGEYSVRCRDLFYEHLCNAVLEGALVFEEASLSFVLEKLLSISGIFELIHADGDYPLISEDYSIRNGAYVINDIKKRYGDFDILVNGLKVSAYKDFKRYGSDGLPFSLIKGKNCSALISNENINNVLTQIIYQYKNDIDELGQANAPAHLLKSEYADLYSFSRSAYVELPDSSDEAYQKLVLDVLDVNKLPRLNYSLELAPTIRGVLDLYDMVKIKYDALNVDVELKVISVSRELKEHTTDVIEIGVKQKTILEYITDIRDEVTTIVSSSGSSSGSSGSGNGIAIDHMPTQAEIDKFADDDIIHVYDPDNPYVPVS